MTLDLWVTRNNHLNLGTPKKPNKIQRVRVIQVETTKTCGRFQSVKTRFPALYRETYRELRDRSTLQIWKWIEIYELCRSTINREDTDERIGCCNK